VREKKILNILETFNEQEWRACHKYLKFCNKKESKGLLLFTYIFKHRADLTSKALEASTVRKKILTGLSDRAFLNLLSDIVKDIEAFMVHDYMISSEGKYDHKSTLTRIFKARGLYKYFERTWREVNNELVTNPQISLFQNLRKLELNHAMYFSDIYEKNTKPVQFLIEADKNRKLFSDDLKTFYDTEFYNLKALVNIEHDESINFKNDILTEIITNLNGLITNEDSNSFNYLENQIYTNSGFISADLKKAIVINLINHCIRQIRLGDKIMENKMADLTLFGLQEGVFLQNNRLSETGFLNIIDTLSHSELDIDGKEFISRWISMVNTADIKSVENMAYVMWAFSKERYDEALQRLNTSEIHINRLNLSLRARWITICSLCTLYDEHNEKKDIIKSSLAFFKGLESKLSPSAYNASINLVKTVELFWNNTNPKEIQQFIEQCKSLAMRTWVNKMINKKT